jgi:D-glycero-D-manno-heptose 1,7-bisphosphate phosphatase
MIDCTPYQLVIFDADGTIRRCTVPGQPCPNQPGEWEYLPGVEAALDRLFACGKHIGICSNQAGVAAGFLTDEAAYDLLAELLEPWAVTGNHQIQYCPHAVDSFCFCRKPSPYLLHSIMAYLHVTDRREVLYVGDRPEDEEAAERAGVDFLWAWEFFGWAETTQQESIDDPEA